MPFDLSWFHFAARCRTIAELRLVALGSRDSKTAKRGLHGFDRGQRRIFERKAINSGRSRCGAEARAHARNQQSRSGKIFQWTGHDRSFLDSSFRLISHEAAYRRSRALFRAVLRSPSRQALRTGAVAAWCGRSRACGPYSPQPSPWRCLPIDAPSNIRFELGEHPSGLRPTVRSIRKTTSPARGCDELSVIAKTRRMDAIRPTTRKGSAMSVPSRTETLTVCRTSTRISTNSNLSMLQ